MYPIVYNNYSRGLNFDEFKDSFLRICSEHKRQKRALAFAFILYGYEQAHIAKILHDTDYWRALNQTSGKYLTVFTVIQRERERHSSRQDELISDDISEFFFDANPSQAFNDIVFMYFNNVKILYPSILFFQSADNNIIDSLIVELKEIEVERAYNEMKKYIDAAVNGLKAIDAKYANNSQEIFDLLELDIKSVTAGNSIIRVAKFALDIASFIGLVKSVV